MLRLGKLTDYAIVLLGALAQNRTRDLAATTLSEKTGLPRPTVAKILKKLHKADMISATRGAQGGYKMVRSPASISIAAVVEAMEGPIALTDCIPEDAAPCAFGANCHHTARWRLVNEAVRSALLTVSLADMATTPTAIFIPDAQQEVMTRP